MRELIGPPVCVHRLALFFSNIAYGWQTTPSLSTVTGIRLKWSTEKATKWTGGSKKGIWQMKVDCEGTVAHAWCIPVGGVCVCVWNAGSIGVGKWLCNNADRHCRCARRFISTPVSAHRWSYISCKPYGAENVTHQTRRLRSYQHQTDDTCLMSTQGTQPRCSWEVHESRLSYAWLLGLVLNKQDSHQAAVRWVLSWRLKSSPFVAKM